LSSWLEDALCVAVLVRDADWLVGAGAEDTTLGGPTEDEAAGADVAPLLAGAGAVGLTGATGAAGAVAAVAGAVADESAARRARSPA
jgi:hypothetical protein